MFQIVMLGSDREAGAQRISARLEQHGLRLCVTEAPSDIAAHKSLGSDLLIFAIDTAIAFGGLGGAFTFVDWAMTKRRQQRGARQHNADLQHAQQLIDLLSSEQSENLTIQIVNQQTGQVLKVDKSITAATLDQLRGSETGI